MSNPVVLTVSEPWDLAGNGEIHGTVADLSAREVRIRLDEPITLAGRACDMAVCSPRYIASAFTHDMIELAVNIAFGSLAAEPEDVPAVLAIGSMRLVR